MKPKPLEKEVSDAKVVSEIRAAQRQRSVCLKSKLMIANRLQAVVAGTLGYHSGMKESERDILIGKARKMIGEVSKGKIECPFGEMIRAHTVGIDMLDHEIGLLEKAMIQLAGRLSVAGWVGLIEQRGFGLLFLAIVIGETGDLSDYTNPAKVWKRMGCAPFSKNDITLMGSTWRGRTGKKGLTSEDWTEFGYSPRRRSIAFLIGDNIVKLNKEGPYRKRYDEVKRLAVQKHPEWLQCSKCKGIGKTERGTQCGNCKGTGEVKMHVHRHAMLLATKLLLKNLWIQWHK